MHFVRHMAPVAAFFGFLVVIMGGTDVHADVTRLSPVSNGNVITVTASYTNSPAGATASLSATGNGSFSAATAIGGQNVQASGTGSKEIKTSPDTSGNTGDVITITATFACQGTGAVSFLLLQVGGSPNNQSVSANCSSTTRLTSPPPRQQADEADDDDDPGQRSRQAPAPPPPPVSTFPQTVGGVPVFAPPNTGDAGLKLSKAWDRPDAKKQKTDMA